MVYDILRIYDIYAVSSTPSWNAFDSFLFDILGIAWGMLGNTVLQSPTKPTPLLGEGNSQMI